MSQIYHMQTAEAAFGAVDKQVIQTLRNSVGDARYQEIAEDAAFMLAERLGRLDRALRDGDYTMCYRHALNVCGISSQIGMAKVANTARDVMKCAKAKDSVALGAVVGRLNRLAESSLATVFDHGL